ncbi:MAG: YMGG-like glycine zipper-containing protein [Vampirovibrionales bacterium]|nr:YMGG-like glycine zipper-containing protein [Vampirovibrionales bacterium]
MNKPYVLISMSLLATVLMSLMAPNIAQAEVKDQARSAWRNPIVKQAAIGAGVGAATGVLTRESSVWKGAGVGALAGAGTGAVDSSRTLRDKPLVRSTAKGAIIGTGAAAVTNRGKVKGAAVGAGAGAGTHFLKKWWDGQ